MLTYENLGLKFKNRSIFQSLSGQITPGEMVGIMGPNGSGKSSFMRCLAHLQKPCTGVVSWDGKPLDTYAPEALSKYRSYARSDITCQWDLKVEDILHLYGNVSPQKTVETLTLVRGESLIGQQFNYLSGGERSLVLLALSLLQDPPLVLLDEITAMLDETYAHGTMKLLQERTEAGKAVAIILHDRALAKKYCHRILEF